jgi:hypothetical protein
VGRSPGNHLSTLSVPERWSYVGFWRLTELRGNILQRVLAQRRGHHRHAGNGCRAGRGQVAVAILGADPDHPDRGREIGVPKVVPNSSTDRSRSVFARSIRGMTPQLSKAVRLLRWVCSSPAPPAT